jgi:hypothetical protein
MGKPFSSSCYCIVTYEWRLEVFGVTRNLRERSAGLHKYPYVLKYSGLIKRRG